MTQGNEMCDASLWMEIIYIPSFLYSSSYITLHFLHSNRVRRDEDTKLIKRVINLKIFVLTIDSSTFNTFYTGGIENNAF